ncbi:type IV secretion system protein [Thiotrichales bacterium 19S3-7]|nr:type IV secretion system protein [Thiotrichales bacterium 19S3-7]MCF6802397.1 type IV secretion system protein [Thiotrichales bacterium 19S3-11]
MADAAQLLGPKLFNSIELVFINKVNAAIEIVKGYSITILFAIAALELALFAIAWVIKQDESLGMLAVKVLKIAMIFLFITMFPYLLQQLIDGFTLIAFKVSGDEAKAYVFSAGNVWKIGFKGGISMLKLAVEYGTYNFGMSFIYLFLGFGTLIIFALIGAQIILLVSVFYAMALAALLLMPLGALKPFEDLLHRVIQGVFKASVRVFGLILVLGVGYTVWSNSQLKLTSVSATTGLEKPLALFFSSLVILVLAYKLPGLLAEAVGKIRSNLFESIHGQPSVSVSAPQVGGYQSTAVVTSSVGGGSMQGTQGGSFAASGQGLAAASTITSTQTPSGATSAAANVNVSASGAGSASAKGAKIGDAASIRSSISDDTLRKLKATVKQAMNEKPSG